jgi:hypothetical protein
MILVTGLFSPQIPEFEKTCRDLGITYKALDMQRIFGLNGRYTDATRGGMLDLMEIANNLHPEIFRYNIPEESAKFGSDPRNNR